jgi:DNA (cytosine-5)-methyltransferase 1
MKFGSVCSGIEAASVAWPFWEAAWFSEIEPFPCAVLKHHYPDVANHGDMTALPDRILSGEVEVPDVFCGGTPCQAFSVAGNRKSLDDARGNLSLTFCEIADAIDSVRYVRNEQPTIIFWENVPGVLNTTDNAFGCFLAKLAGESCELQPPGGRWTDSGCVYGPKRAIAWRVLDAQYFGLAQRRRRVFVVASAREGINPSEVLFEFSGERRDTAPSRKTGQGITADAESGFVAMAHGQGGAEIAVNRSPTLTCNHEAPILCFEPRSPDGHARVIGNIAPCLNTMGGGQREPCVTYGIQGNMIGRADTAGPQGNGFSEEVGYMLTTGDVHGVATIAPPPCIQDSRGLRRRR